MDDTVNTISFKDERFVVGRDDHPPKGRQVPSLKHDPESWFPTLVVYRTFAINFMG